MSKYLKITENKINMVFEITEEKDIRLLHFSYLPFEAFPSMNEDEKAKCRLIELQFTGENQLAHRGVKHTGTLPGYRMIYKGYTDERTPEGRKISIHLLDEITKVAAQVIFQFYDGLPVVRTWSVLTNKGRESAGLEYISSFSLTGIDRGGVSERDSKMKIHIPRNEWCGEAMWKEFSLEDAGIFHVEEESTNRMLISNTGNWSTCQYAPCGFVENEEISNGLMWQIENNGSWNMEISDSMNMLYLKLSGPSEAENHFWKELRPGESFESVKTAVASVGGGLQSGIEVMTQYRRRIRRKNDDNKKLSVIFNDYMNCLNGDPTTEKLFPLIDAAAEAGCEYFCIDCGWYSDGYWWDGVGEWLPSKKRFPNGIKEPLEYIRKKGMIPGLWLELEVMGIKCELANKLPDDWFFMRHGRRIKDHSRYQLDYRNPQVREYASGIIKRVVEEYGVGYIKMDYNINMGIGTDNNADSAGEGLLEHNRAYLKWIDEIFEKYPDLIIENCGSGGLRMDYAMLERHSIQSVSDQTDYRKNAVIAAAASSLVTPEQSAVWSYPLRNGDKEEVICNMVNSMLLRIHQSGHLAEINEERFRYIKEGIEYYKSIRHNIPNGIPFWPIKMPALNDGWIAYGLNCEDISYLSVWRMKSENEAVEMKLDKYKNKDIEINAGYPKCDHNLVWSWNQRKGILTLKNPVNYSSRVLEIREL